MASLSSSQLDLTSFYARRRCQFFLEDARGNLIASGIEMTYTESIEANAAFQRMRLPYRWFPLEDY